MDALTNEVKQTKTSVTKLHKDLADCPDDVKNQLKTFIQVSFMDLFQACLNNQKTIHQYDIIRKTILKK